VTLDEVPSVATVTC